MWFSISLGADLAVLLAIAIVLYWIYRKRTCQLKYDPDSISGIASLIAEEDENRGALIGLFDKRHQKTSKEFKALVSNLNCRLRITRDSGNDRECCVFELCDPTSLRASKTALREYKKNSDLT